MNIQKTENGIVRLTQPSVVRRLSDGMLGHLSPRDNVITWRDQKTSNYEAVINDVEIVRIPKPEGYNNVYESYYGEGGTFWPLPGDKVIFKGVKSRFWFTDIVDNANTLLEIGKQYTLKMVEPASSWVCVRLEEFPEHDFALYFFDYDI
jgi:hypothetical protein